ncbi:MAG: hypothetical protein LBV37_02030 [Mycoplasmataceae bacterium]|jgi:hypothetical protein|nr:hypothetical protein [Mycoplasmataceae bacterium]
MGKKMYEVNITERINKDNLVVQAEELKSTKPIPSVPAWFQAFEARLNTRLDSIESRLTCLEKDVTGLKIAINRIDERLSRVIELNNLKE